MQNAVSTTPSEFAKYIVLLWQDREQVTVFPFSVKHAEVLRYMRRECPEIKAVSAGFFIGEGDTVWCNGGSESLSRHAGPTRTGRPSKPFWTAPTGSNGISRSCQPKPEQKPGRNWPKRIVNHHSRKSHDS